MCANVPGASKQKHCRNASTSSSLGALEQHTQPYASKESMPDIWHTLLRNAFACLGRCHLARQAPMYICARQIWVVSFCLFDERLHCVRMIQSLHSWRETSRSPLPGLIPNGAHIEVNHLTLFWPQVSVHNTPPNVPHYSSPCNIV